MTFPCYYDRSSDELKPVSQEWVDETNKIQLLSFKRNEIIKRIANLNIVKKEALIVELSKRLGI